MDPMVTGKNESKTTISRTDKQVVIDQQTCLTPILVLMYIAVEQGILQLCKIHRYFQESYPVPWYPILDINPLTITRDNLTTD